MERVACKPEALEIIRVVRDEVLTSADRWTQRVFMRDKDGYEGDVYAIGDLEDLNGYQFCLLGACKIAARIIHRHSLRNALSYDAEQCLTMNVRARTDVEERPFYSVPPFNDDPRTTFNDVRDFLNFVLGEEKGSDGGKTEGSESSA